MARQSLEDRLFNGPAAPKEKLKHKTPSITGVVMLENNEPITMANVDDLGRVWIACPPVEVVLTGKGPDGTTRTKTFKTKPIEFAAPLDEA